MSKQNVFFNIILCLSLTCIVLEKWTYYAVLVIFLLAFRKIVINRKMYIDINVLLLSIFCTCSFIATNRVLSLANIFHEFTLVILYFSAINYYEEDSDNNRKLGVNTIIFVLALAYITRLTATVIGNTITGYIFTNAYLIDPVTQEATSPTLYSPMMIIPMCVLFYLLRSNEIKKVYLLVYTVLVAWLFYVTAFMLARRMVILILIALLFVTIVSTRKVSRSRFIIVYTLTTAGIICLLVFGQNIINRLSSTYLFERFSGVGIGSTSRWDKVAYYLSHFLENLSGGNHMRQVIGYAHNLWLDVYDTAGLIPFIALLIVTVLILTRFIQNKSLFRENEVKLLVLFFVSSYIHFFTEPAYYSLINYMWVFAFISGYISKRYKTTICCII